MSFRYRPEYDPQGVPQFGLIAEQVAKVDPDLVARDAQGKIYTVRYEQVNAMLLNEFLKEHQRVGQLRDILARQQSQIDALTAAVKARASNDPAPLISCPPSTARRRGRMLWEGHRNDRPGREHVPGE